MNSIIQFERIIQDNDEEEISEWLISGYLTELFFDLKLNELQSVELQLKKLYEQIHNHNIRNKFRNAIIHALSTFNFNVDNIEILESLITLAAYVREIRVIDYIRVYIADEWINQINSDKKIPITSLFLAVINGFAPDEKSYMMLKSLYVQDVLDSSFALQLFIGLCKCNPELFYEYVPTLIDSLTIEGDSRLDYFVIEFLKIVGPIRLSSYINNIKEGYFSSFLDLFTTIDDYPFDIYPDRNLNGIAYTYTEETDGDDLKLVKILSSIDDVDPEKQLDYLLDKAHQDAVSYAQKNL